MDHKIVLASASPRRTELMELAGISFEVVPADIDETALSGEMPEEHVLRLAREKASAAAGRAVGRYFIGADTVVVLEGRIMGKPADESEAAEMLRLLSGRSHSVLTGIAVLDRLSGKKVCKCVETKVYFKALTDREILDYIATGCPMDKAGAYAIQGGAIHFVRRIEGSYSNVIGLPMTELYEMLQDMQKGEV
jgi:septum formation protein